MPRKMRSDATVSTIEKSLGIREGSIRNESGRKTRKDATLGTLRKRAEKKQK